MKISSFICLTNPERRGDTYKECIQSALGFSDEVVIVDGFSTDGSLNWIRSLDDSRIKIVFLPWGQEFDWLQISKAFQFGYDSCTGDWGVHLDADFILHQDDYNAFRQAMIDNQDEPALSLWKWQVFTPDRYNLKSRLVIAVNKAKYGDRIKFDGGGQQDLCQPSLDGKYIDPSSVPEARVKFLNFEKICKTKEQITDDVGRMARAWTSHFGNDRLGGPDNESAYNEWWKMIEGRYKNHLGRLSPDDIPAIMKPTLAGLRDSQFGSSAFGLKTQ